MTRAKYVLRIRQRNLKLLETQVHVCIIATSKIYFRAKDNAVLEISQCYLVLVAIVVLIKLIITTTTHVNKAKNSGPMARMGNSTHQVENSQDDSGIPKK